MSDTEDIVMYTSPEDLDAILNPFDTLANIPQQPFELSDIQFNIEEVIARFPMTTTINQVPITTQVMKPTANNATIMFNNKIYQTAQTSPSGSSFSTEDFPGEVDEIEDVESELDSDEISGEITIREFNFPIFIVNKEDEDKTDPNNLEPILAKRSMRQRHKRRSYSPDSAENDSDPDFDPEEYEEKKTVNRFTTNKISDSEFDDIEEQITNRKPSSVLQKRRTSKHPIPQQRKAGSKQKISQWIVSLLRSPEHNPSVITWEDEPRGRFRITDSIAYARLWGSVKGNPAMNYEKLSRAMRYYYKNGEIVVVNNRLTYAFGPLMRDFRAYAKDRDDPNFEIKTKF